MGWREGRRAYDGICLWVGEDDGIRGMEMVVFVGWVGRDDGMLVGWVRIMELLGRMGWIMESVCEVGED